MKKKVRRTHARKNQRGAARSKRKRSVKRPSTVRQYFAMSPEDRETWDSVAHVISKMRDGVSLPRASKEFGIARSVVLRLGRPALRKKNRRYIATKTDQLPRVLTMLGNKGKKTIATRDSRQASLVGGHWAAVQKYLQTGDYTDLLKFKNKSVIDANGKRHRLLTDLEKLNRLASAGVLSFESMYAGGLR